MLLDESGRAAIYPCIRDLLVNGLDVSRFKPSDPIPNRQDVTQYVAAWCRGEARLEEDECRTWLCDYALSMLSSLSRSSPSAIRHSTKSNVKYIYRSEPPFVCERESNRFRAACSPTCPVYSEMETRSRTPTPTRDSLTTMVHQKATEPSMAAILPVKERYRKQFQSAVRLISDELSKGTKKAEILALLQKKRMKTRTGRKWTYAILNSEIKKLGHKRKPEAASAPPRSTEPEDGRAKLHERPK